LLELLGRRHLPRHGLGLSDRPSRTLDGAGRREDRAHRPLGRSTAAVSSSVGFQLLGLPLDVCKRA
jgi:hypothetical protein